MRTHQNITNTLKFLLHNNIKTEVKETTTRAKMKQKKKEIVQRAENNNKVHMIGVKEIAIGVLVEMTI